MDNAPPQQAKHVENQASGYRGNKDTDHDKIVLQLKGM